MPAPDVEAQRRLLGRPVRTAAVMLYESVIRRRAVMMMAGILDWQAGMTAAAAAPHPCMIQRLLLTSVARIPHVRGPQGAGINEKTVAMIVEDVAAAVTVIRRQAVAAVPGISRIWRRYAWIAVPTLYRRQTVAGI